MWNPITAITDSMIDASANILDKAIGGQSMSAVKTLTSFTAHSDYFTNYWSIINSSISLVKPFGYALITTYFLMYLFDAAAKDNVTVDSLIKVLIQLVLVIAMIKNLDVIINSFLSLGDTLINKFAGSGKMKGFSGSSLKGEEIVKTWHETDTAATIFLQSVIMWLFAKISHIAVYFAAITRAIEVGWRIVFAPIGVANCFDGGMNSKGIQYMKTLGVVILSGAVIYLTTAIGYAIVAGLLSAASDGDTLGLAIAAMLGTAGAAVGVSGKVRDLA